MKSILARLKATAGESSPQFNIAEIDKWKAEATRLGYSLSEVQAGYWEAMHMTLIMGWFRTDAGGVLITPGDH